MIEPIFAGANISCVPFPHVRIPRILDVAPATASLRWLRENAPWCLRIADFYEQHEFSLLTSELSAEIAPLVEPSFLGRMRQEIRSAFDLENEPVLVDVNAHRLMSGQTIRIHNDYIEGEETHRLLIQLNDGWSAEQGGLLMLFSGPSPGDVRNVILPRHGSGFAFEISPRSYHAVSQIRAGERYTLVYSYRNAA